MPDGGRPHPSRSGAARALLLASALLLCSGASCRGTSGDPSPAADEQVVLSTEAQIAVLRKGAPDGLVVFRAGRSAGPARPGAMLAGAYDGTELVLGAEETFAKLAAAWGYRQGDDLPAPADEIARVLSFIGGDPQPVLSDEDVRYMPAEARAHVHPPRRTTVDGHPAVVLWHDTEARPPLVRVEAVFLPGGELRVSYRLLSEILEE